MSDDACMPSLLKPQKPQKPPKPPKPNWESEVLRLLLNIAELQHTTIQVLKTAEKNNQMRHIELMTVLNPKASNIKITFGEPQLK